MNFKDFSKWPRDENAENQDAKHTRRKSDNRRKKL